MCIDAVYTCDNCTFSYGTCYGGGYSHEFMGLIVGIAGTVGYLIIMILVCCVLIACKRRKLKEQAKRQEEHASITEHVASNGYIPLSAHVKPPSYPQPQPPSYAQYPQPYPVQQVQFIPVQYYSPVVFTPPPQQQ
jgi:uncharacterized membrane protein